MTTLDGPAYAALVAGAEVLSRDGHGDKVLALRDGRVVKLFRSKGFFSSNTLIPYAVRFARAARRLSERGIGTVEVLAVHRIPSLRRQAVVYRRLEGDALRSLVADPDPGRGEMLVGALADFLARLHQSGVYFRSLHFGNLLVGPEGGFHLIDVLEAKFSAGPLTVDRRVRNFRHLLPYAEDREAIRRHGVERFVDRYVEAAGLEPGRIRALREGLTRLDPFFAGVQARPMQA